MDCAFISDVHLRASDPYTTDLFFDFLDQSSRYRDGLYILGDLFSCWLGDRGVDDFEELIMMRLSQLTIPLYIMHGNRDFLMGRDFFRITKAKFLKDMHVITLDDQRILLTHGDLLCTQDVFYQYFRKIVRNPLIKTAFTLLPRSARHATARLFEKKEDKSGLYIPAQRQAIEQAVQLHQAEYLIYGHTHETHQLYLNEMDVACYNLGCWQSKRPSVLIWSNGEPNLMHLHKFMPVSRT